LLDEVPGRESAECGEEVVMADAVEGNPDLLLVSRTFRPR
jgi:hypothetical protein